VRLLRRPAFGAALVLNVVGFGLHITALQSLPLFLVQAVISCSVAVTALLSVRVFGVSLTRGQRMALVAVFVGLGMLAPTASSNGAAGAGTAGVVALVAAVAAVLVLSLGAVRLATSTAALALGLLAGASFGIVAVSARLLPDLSPLTLVRSPVSYVLCGAGLVAFLLYSMAMQRGSVTTSAAAVVVTQTAVPALVGAVLLGDRVRSGLVPLAVAGFALAVLGALGLARFEAEGALTQG